MSQLKTLLFICFSPILLWGQSDFDRGVQLFEKEQFDWAKVYFLKDLKSHPDRIKSIEYLGDIAAYNKDWDTAIDRYKRLLEEDDHNANYHFKYGGSLGMKALKISKIRAVGYVSLIKRHLKQAALLDPNHVEVRWALVELYMQLPGILGGSEDVAIDYAQELMDISPVDGYLSMGYVAEYSDRPDDAETYYRKAIEIGGSPLTYEKLTKLYENQKKPQDAINNASESLRIHKRNQLNYQIGKIAAQYKLESELGIRCLQAYIDNHSVKDGVPVDWAYLRLAQIYRNMGDTEKALEWIEKAIASRPDFEEAIEEKNSILGL